MQLRRLWSGVHWKEVRKGDKSENRALKKQCCLLLVVFIYFDEDRFDFQYDTSVRFHVFSTFEMSG